MSGKIMRNMLKFNTLRRIVQFVSFVLFSAAIFNLDFTLLLPILWTWSSQGKIAVDALTAMQLMLYHAVFPWLAFASFLTFGVLTGKSLCGWICPFGFVQDMLSFIKRKKSEFSPRTHESMLCVKYFVLGLALFISFTFAASKHAGVQESYEKALGIFARAPFTAISPAETLFSTVPGIIRYFRTATSDVYSLVTGLPPLFWTRIVIMVGVLIFAVYFSRGWCKYFCPHGAVMAIINRFSFLGLRRDLARCSKGECRLCVEACPMHVKILDLPWDKFNDSECIYCLKCVDACPNGAIKMKYL